MKAISEMKVLRKLSMILCFGIMISFLSCEDKDDVAVPSLVHVVVKNIPEGARISYKVPEGSDIASINVEFDGDGEKESFDIASHPSNFTLTNLPTNERMLKLYAVNSRGISSRIGDEVKINPLLKTEIAYLNTVLNSVRMTPTLGGLDIDFLNSAKKDLTFNLSYKNSTGQWVNYTPLIKSSKEIGSIVLGEFTSKDVKLFLSDKDSNKSTLKEFTIVPANVIKLDKTKFKSGRLPGDADFSGGYPIEFLWNNDTATHLTYKTDIVALPHTFTVDLGQVFKLTRIHMHYYARWGVFTYNFNDPKVYEIYGSNSPAVDGTWDSWKFLVKCEKFKPSGKPLGEWTPEDEAYNFAGETFKFPTPHVGYRYLRFKVLETWAHKAPDVVASQFSEITPFGF